MNKEEKIKIEVIGMGKAGIPLACVIASNNLNVIGVDIDKIRVETLNKKRNPIPEEPGVSEILEETIGKNFSVNANPIESSKKCNVHIVIVPLFIDKKTKIPDFSIIKSAFENISIRFLSRIILFGTKAGTFVPIRIILTCSILLILFMIFFNRSDESINGSPPVNKTFVISV